MLIVQIYEDNIGNTDDSAQVLKVINVNLIPFTQLPPWLLSW